MDDLELAQETADSYVSRLVDVAIDERWTTVASPFAVSEPVVTRGGLADIVGPRPR